MRVPGPLLPGRTRPLLGEGRAANHSLPRSHVQSRFQFAPAVYRPAKIQPARTHSLYLISYGRVTIEPSCQIGQGDSLTHHLIIVHQLQHDMSTLSMGPSGGPCSHRARAGRFRHSLTTLFYCDPHAQAIDVVPRKGDDSILRRFRPCHLYVSR